LNVLIVEDNLSYALEYEMILEKFDYNVLGVFKNSSSALKSINKVRPDFMIIDLFLEGNDKGLDFLESVKNYRIPFIICTGYPEEEYMDIAHDLGAEAFFTKPLDKNALTYGIRHIAKKIESKSPSEKNILVKYKRKLIRVPHIDILKIETKGNYSYLHVEGDQKYIIKLSLKKVYNELDQQQFRQANRSSIVNLDKVKQIDTYNKKVILKNKDEVVLGRRFKEEFMRCFTEKNGQRLN